jgi:DUF971 family protein
MRRQNVREDKVSTDHWPTELRLDEDKAVLSVSFESGEVFRMTAEYLRVMSPSAEVQGHAPEERRTVPGKRNVRVSKLEPVGHYAVKIVFSDGHETGLYTWTYLFDLGARHDERWAGYLKELETKGLSRD